jgi:hypothetical protein
MRSQVQVLAGPPAIPPGHSAAGSELGAPAASPGRTGAARPPPPARPLALPGPATPGGRHHDHHPTWSPTSPRAAATRPLRPPRAAACSSARSAAASDGAPHAGQACPVPSGQARPPSPNPARVHHRPHRQRASSAASPASGPARPSTQPLHGVGAQRTSTRCCGEGYPPHRPGPQRHRPRWDETDASGPTGGGQQPAGHRTGWTLDGWTPDGWTPDAGHRTAGHRTLDTRRAGHWTAGPRRRNRWVDTTWWTRTGDRRHGRCPGLAGHDDNARPLDAGWTLCRAAAIWATNQDSSAARTTRTGPATAAIVSCG